MDLIVDSFGHAILVLPDRLTGFVLLERLKHGKMAKPLAKVVIRLLFGYRKYLKTITTDNYSEFAANLDITAGLRMKGLPDATCTSPTATVHGKKVRWRMSLNFAFAGGLYGGQILMRLPWQSARFTFTGL